MEARYVVWIVLYDFLHYFANVIPLCCVTQLSRQRMIVRNILHDFLDRLCGFSFRDVTRFVEVWWFTHHFKGFRLLRIEPLLSPHLIRFYRGDVLLTTFSFTHETDFPLSSFGVLVLHHLGEISTRDAIFIYSKSLGIQCCFKDLDVTTTKINTLDVSSSWTPLRSLSCKLRRESFTSMRCFEMWLILRYIYSLGFVLHTYSAGVSLN